MAKVCESVGSTYDEALKKGLEQIGLTEDEVNIEIVKDASTTKSFFSILEPRTVKLIITEKNSVKASKEASEHFEQKQVVEKEIVELDEETIEMAKKKINEFMAEYTKNMELEIKTDISYDKGIIFVNLIGDGSGIIIGHRGETLEALQTLMSAVVNKGSETRIKIILDSENYREKRANSLKGLALREAEQVVKKKRNFTFEPMSAFERKAIHTALQDNKKVTTYSIGEEPYRKVVIALK